MVVRGLIDMVNVKSDPDINVKKLQGDVTFPDDGEGILLGLGNMLTPNSNGGIILNNKSKSKWLEFTRYDEIPGARKAVETGKVNPGKGVSIHTVPASQDLGHYPQYIGSFKWTDKDPNPSDKGGQSDAERQLGDAWAWIKANAWIAVLLAVLVIIMIIFYLYKVRSVG